MLLLLVCMYRRLSLRQKQSFLGGMSIVSQTHLRLFCVCRH